MNESSAHLTNRAFLHTASHVYLHPHPLLAPYIAHYTICRKQVENHVDYLILIPDIAGCIVFTPGKRHVEMKFWGAMTQTITVKNSDSTFRFFIEFKPGGAYTLTGIPQRILLNKQIALEQLLPAWHKQFEEAWFSCKTMDSFLEIIEDFLIANMSNQDQMAFVKQALPIINNHQDLSSICGFSARHLNRMFHDMIGTSYKGYERLVKINRALVDIQNTSLSLTEISYRCGYYDQSHFIHDFKRICGVTPGKYRKQMSIFYNETFKF